MLEGRGRYWKSGKKVYIYVPIEVALDSAFPLRERKGDVRVEIRGKEIVISRC